MSAPVRARTKVEKAARADWIATGRKEVNFLERARAGGTVIDKRGRDVTSVKSSDPSRDGSKVGQTVVVVPKSVSDSVLPSKGVNSAVWRSHHPIAAARIDARVAQQNAIASDYQTRIAANAADQSRSSTDAAVSNAQRDAVIADVTAVKDDGTGSVVKTETGQDWGAIGGLGGAAVGFLTFGPPGAVIGLIGGMFFSHKAGDAVEAAKDKFGTVGLVVAAGGVAWWLWSRRKKHGRSSGGSSDEG